MCIGTFRHLFLVFSTNQWKPVKASTEGNPLLTINAFDIKSDINLFSLHRSDGYPKPDHQIRVLYLFFVSVCQRQPPAATLIQNLSDRHLSILLESKAIETKATAGDN
ncbi:hypothetical protein L2E82_13860 [Cichorium intybus]|uniref:Uncharacterized protein n=1 Tax=Cichorium intybus TaxID=13427 RepID=A0ACB9EYD3_CICIN|nr:hypothetical protein L2E82_13860 [Cichorium intybus]